MRVLKSSSTKSERIFYEILKRNHISFQHRKMVDGREIDFVIGKYAIEIDGHQQSAARNSWLFRKGYIPVHYPNYLLRHNPRQVEEDIKTKTIWLSQQNHSQAQ